MHTYVITANTIIVPPIMETSTPMIKVNTNVEKEVSFSCKAFGNPQPQVIWIGENGVLNDDCNGELNSVFGEAAFDYDEFYENIVFNDPTPYIPQNCEILISTDPAVTEGPQTTTSVLTIKDLHSESINYTSFRCFGENGISNMIQEKEFVTVELELEGIGAYTYKLAYMHTYMHAYIYVYHTYVTVAHLTIILQIYHIFCNFRLLLITENLKHPSLFIVM